MKNILNICGICAIFLLQDSCFARTMEELKNCVCVQEFAEKIHNQARSDRDCANLIEEIYKYSHGLDTETTSSKKSSNKKHYRESITNYDDDINRIDDYYNNSTRNNRNDRNISNQYDNYSNYNGNRRNSNKKNRETRDQQLDRSWMNEMALLNISEFIKTDSFKSLNLLAQNDKSSSITKNTQKIEDIDKRKIRQSVDKVRYRITDQNSKELRQELERYRQIFA
ncbi:MAG: hypothetical protein IJ730_01420 [Alphaproteobacteria bacterium]|nr:hypothetical protein [Alphaproteobacteria bacterium]